MPAQIDEIAPDVYRICIYIPQISLQFNQFLVKDDEPLLFHAGFRSLFPHYLQAVKTILDPSTIRWIGFSHFESDECGALNEWLEAAPEAEPLCSFLAANVNVMDFSDRPPKGLMDGEIVETGKLRFRLLATPHVPHNWDAAVLFEETQSVLFCSDILTQHHECEPIAPAATALSGARRSIEDMNKTPFANYSPYTPWTDATYEKLASLEPQTLAAMHGSSVTGDCSSAIRGYGAVVKECAG